jgi:SAM-dependent methyltransferase
VDKDRRALQRCQRRLSEHFPALTLHLHVTDFTRSLDGLPALDGIVMANALHFQRDKRPVLERLRAIFKPGGRLIVVEYDTARGNHWVPYPLTYDQYARLAASAGFIDTRRLGTRPSSFLGGFFSAGSVSPP